MNTCIWLDSRHLSSVNRILECVDGRLDVWDDGALESMLKLYKQVHEHLKNGELMCFIRDDKILTDVFASMLPMYTDNPTN